MVELPPLRIQFFKRDTELKTTPAVVVGFATDTHQQGCVRTLRTVPDQYAGHKSDKRNNRSAVTTLKGVNLKRRIKLDYSHFFEIQSEQRLIIFSTLTDKMKVNPV